MKIFTIGAGCQARTCRRILLNEHASLQFGARQINFPLVYDGNESLPAPWLGCHILHNWANAKELAKTCTHFVVAIGSNGKKRQELAEELVSLGLHPISVIHPTASIGEETQIGKGLQILANARIGDEVTIGDWCMIHSLGMVEHESVVGDGVTIMAHAAVAGLAHLGNHCTIGVNATVKAVRIGEGAMIGDGALIVKDVPPHLTVVGSPPVRTWPKKSA